MKKIRKSLFTSIVCLVVSIMLVSCTNFSPKNNQKQPLNSVENSTESLVAEQQNIEKVKLTDDKRLYDRDIDSSIKYLYVTVPHQQKESAEVDWYGLNRQPDKSDPQVLDIILQEGIDESGPAPTMFQYGAQEVNASIQLRGNSAWNEPQKSYRIKLYDKAGTYMDQTTINLNKHRSDLSRLRNKLAFDLMETLPDMVSMRTQFVHLFVRDYTSGNTEAVYEDYGLFTHVEHPNKTYLKTHQLDRNGYFYKGAFFEFRNYDEIVNTEDPSYDETSFEQFLEIRGRNDHARLIEFINVINDYSYSINDVVDKYLDEDNYLTWLAMNILMDNVDTDAHNFLLYSPLNIEKWYFVPWDYDGGFEKLRSLEQIRMYQAGISNYWGSILHNRYFRHQANVDKLTAKLEEIYINYINETTIRAYIDSYLPITQYYINRMPDVMYLPDKLEKYDSDIEMIINTPKNALTRYYEDLEKPKPFFMHREILMDDMMLQFGWEPSYDLQGDPIHYEIFVAKDPYLKDIIVKDTAVPTTAYSIPKLDEGTYYWQVLAVDSKGNKQYNFEQIKIDDGTPVSSILRFEVLP